MEIHGFQNVAMLSIVFRAFFIGGGGSGKTSSVSDKSEGDSGRALWATSDLPEDSHNFIRGQRVYLTKLSLKHACL